MATTLEGKLIGSGLKIGIVATRWNDFMGQRMLEGAKGCLLYTSPSPRDRQKSRMPSSA